MDDFERESDLQGDSGPRPEDLGSPGTVDETHVKSNVPLGSEAPNHPHDERTHGAEDDTGLGDEKEESGGEEVEEELNSLFEEEMKEDTPSEASDWDEGVGSGEGGYDYSAGRDIYSADGDIHVAGGHIYSTKTGDINFGPPPEKFKFEQIPEAISDRLRDVFVEPPGYQDLLQNGSLHQRRVLLVHGPDHSGKWTCAVNIAHALSLRVYEYSRPIKSEAPLAAAVYSPELPENAVVLLRDCFERNVLREELEPSQLQKLIQRLSDKKTILILTGDLAREHLESLFVVKLFAQVEDLHEVLESNLRYWIEHERLLLSERQVAVALDKTLWKKLESLLTTPFHIHQFCSKLPRAAILEAKEKRLLESVLIRLANEVAIGGSQATRGWFDALHPNERLFALLVYLFAGAERRWVEELGYQLVERFRAAGFEWFSDPREHGLEDVRERIQAVERGERLEFADRVFEREVRRQVVNRQHLLWEALGLLVHLKPDGAWSDAWKRQALGVALGRLGVHDHGRLEATLQDMATDGDKLRAVIPGYAFQEMVQESLGNEAEFVIRLLRTWVRSRNHKMMWAAGAALWRVYLAAQSSDVPEHVGALKKQTLGLVRLLGLSLALFELLPMKGERGNTEKTNDRNVGQKLEKRKREIWWSNFQCVVDAMRRIALADPEGAVSELTVWMVGASGSLSALGRRTVRVVYEAFARVRYRPSEAQQEPLLRLLSPLLEKASDESVDVETIFLTLRGWLRWPELANRVHAELLYIATYSSSQPRARLRSIVARLWLNPQPGETERAALQLIRSNRRGQQKGSDHRERQEVMKLVSFWCHGTEKEAHRIAQAVAVRCYAVDGALPSLPGMGPGIVVVDPALLLPTERDIQEKSASSIWNLLALLESRMDLKLLRLGQTEPVDLFGSSLSAVELLPQFASHRLLMPGLKMVRQSQKEEQRESVFILAPRKPHDFDDLLGQPWLQSLYYLGPSSEYKEAREDRYVHLDLVWPPSHQSLEKAVSALESFWARALVSEPVERWLELKRASGIEEGTDWATQLEVWARDLDGPSTASVPDEDSVDPVRKSLALSLWLAATDLRACLTWIRSWLSLPDQASDSRAKRAIGAATAFALIRLYTAYPPEGTGTGRASPLLFEMLAEPLGGQGSDGVDALVRLVKHWLVDPVWAEYLAGDVREGRGRLDRWTGKYLYNRPDLASDLADRVAASRPVEGVGESWVALAAVVDRLKAQRALENPRSLPNLGLNQRYVLLVIGTDSGNEDLRRHLAEVTANLYGELANENGASLVPAVYRLGECRPFWAGTEERPVPERLLPRGMRLSRLIGPLLKTVEEKRDQISTVLVITGTAPIDLDDWVDSAWWSKIKLYGDGSPPSVASFATLPEPTGFSASITTTDQLKFEAGRVATYLSGLWRPIASGEPISA